MKTKVRIVQGRITQPTVLKVPDCREWIHIEHPICLAFGVTVAELHSRSRITRISHPRFLAMDLIRKRGGLSSKKAAAYFGMDHANCLWGGVRIEELTDTDPIFRARRHQVESAL